MIVLTFAAGVAQVVLAHHWSSDVLAGWALGLYWSALTLLIYVRYDSRAYPVSPDGHSFA